MRNFTSSDQGIEDVQEKTVKMVDDDWFQEVYEENVREDLNSQKEKLWEWDGDSWLRMHYISTNIRHKKNFHKCILNVSPCLLPPTMSAQILQNVGVTSKF